MNSITVDLLSSDSECECILQPRSTILTPSKQQKQVVPTTAIDALAVLPTQSSAIDDTPLDAEMSADIEEVLEEEHVERMNENNEPRYAQRQEPLVIEIDDSSDEWEDQQPAKVMRSCRGGVVEYENRKKFREYGSFPSLKNNSKDTHFSPLRKIDDSIATAHERGSRRDCVRKCSLDESEKEPVSHLHVPTCSSSRRRDRKKRKAKHEANSNRHPFLSSSETQHQTLRKDATIRKSDKIHPKLPEKNPKRMKQSKNNQEKREILFIDSDSESENDTDSLPHDGNQSQFTYDNRVKNGQGRSCKQRQDTDEALRTVTGTKMQSARNMMWKDQKRKSKGNEEELEKRESWKKWKKTAYPTGDIFETETSYKYQRAETSSSSNDPAADNLGQWSPEEGDLARRVAPHPLPPMTTKKKNAKKKKKKKRKNMKTKGQVDRKEHQRKRAKARAADDSFLTEIDKLIAKSEIAETDKAPTKRKTQCRPDGRTGESMETDSRNLRPPSERDTSFGLMTNTNRQRDTRPRNADPVSKKYPNVQKPRDQLDKPRSFNQSNILPKLSTCSSSQECCPAPKERDCKHSSKGIDHSNDENETIPSKQKLVGSVVHDLGVTCNAQEHPTSKDCPRQSAGHEIIRSKDDRQAKEVGESMDPTKKKKNVPTAACSSGTQLSEQPALVRDSISGIDEQEGICNADVQVDAPILIKQAMQETKRNRVRRKPLDLLRKALITPSHVDSCTSIIREGGGLKNNSESKRENIVVPTSKVSPVHDDSNESRVVYDIAESKEGKEDSGLKLATAQSSCIQSKPKGAGCGIGQVIHRVSVTGEVEKQSEDFRSLERDRSKKTPQAGTETGQSKGQTSRMTSTSKMRLAFVEGSLDSKLNPTRGTTSSVGRNVEEKLSRIFPERPLKTERGLSSDKANSGADRLPPAKIVPQPTAKPKSAVHMTDGRPKIVRNEENFKEGASLASLKPERRYVPFCPSNARERIRPYIPLKLTSSFCSVRKKPVAKKNRYRYENEYNYKMSAADAQEQQERLFREAAESMRHQGFGNAKPFIAAIRNSYPPSYAVPSSTSTVHPVFTQSVDPGSLAENHWKWQDYHARLGLSLNAGRSRVRSSFLYFAKRYHPDKSKMKDAAARFHAVKEAYEALQLLCAHE